MIVGIFGDRLMSKENYKGKELCVAKTIDSPLGSVWQAWVNPEHLVHWWAPEGFTTTVRKMVVAEGEEWLLTLHGPDGKNCPNRAIYKEIVPLKKIVYEHFNPDFMATAVFEADGNKTVLQWTMLFETVELFDIVVKTFKADEGLKQNVAKLESYLLEGTTK